MPDPVARESLLQVLATTAAFLGVLVAVVAAGIGLGAVALTGSPEAMIVTKIVCALVASPLWGLALVWVCRWQLDRIDRRGRSERGGVPAARTQPGDRDLLYAAPVALACAFFFLSL